MRRRVDVTAGGGWWTSGETPLPLWRLVGKWFQARLDQSVSYYVPGEERAHRVADLFASIAKRYDLINDVQSLGLHRWWKRKVIGLTGAQAGQRALDVCCGTGDLTLALAERRCETIGIDFSQPMLDVARRRGDAIPIEHRPQFLHGDALHLPFPDAEFDVITVAYGLRNLADVDRGLRELLRVLRPGGRLVILEFGKPSWSVLRSLWFGYLRLALPMFGWVFVGNARAYAYIWESLIHYPGQMDIQRRLVQLGATEGQLMHLMGGMMSLHVVLKGSAESV